MSEKQNIKSGGLTTKHWFGYMFGDFGGCMTFALMASIFSMYCTNVLGVNATLMGVLTIVWTIWDAVNDPMMGALMDKAFAKSRNKRGKFRPWLLRATPLLAISAIWQAGGASALVLGDGESAMKNPSMPRLWMTMLINKAPGE